MMHTWKTYNGFTENFEYCEKCDQKKGSADYNCSVTVVATPERGWYILNLIDFSTESDQCKRSWSGVIGVGKWTERYSFSADDYITQLEFEDGRILSPNEVFFIRDNRDLSSPGTKFRFRRIRGEWRGKYGITADEYHYEAGTGTGAGLNNQNAGNTNGSQHGQASQAGLGRVPHTLAYRNSLFEYAWAQQLSHDVSQNNDGQDEEV